MFRASTITEVHRQFAFFSEVCLCKGHDRADPFLHRRQRDAPEVKKIEFRLPLEKISEVYKRGVDKYQHCGNSWLSKANDPIAANMALATRRRMSAMPLPISL